MSDADKRKREGTFSGRKSKPFIGAKNIMRSEERQQQQQEMMQQQLQLVTQQQEQMNSPRGASLAHEPRHSGATTPRQEADLPNQRVATSDTDFGSDGCGESGDEGVDHLMSTNERLRDELSGLREQVQASGD